MLSIQPLGNIFPGFRLEEALIYVGFHFQIPLIWYAEGENILVNDLAGGQIRKAYLAGALSLLISIQAIKHALGTACPKKQLDIILIGCIVVGKPC